MGIGTISTYRGDYTFQSADDVINFIRTVASENKWLSYNDKNQKEDTFMAGGDEWSPDVDAIIALNDAFSCIREFLDTLERPSCIQWQKL